MRFAALLVLMGIAGCSTPSETLKKPEASPLEAMLGKWQERGTFFAGGKSIPIAAHSRCEPLTDNTGIVCHGQSGRAYAWLDVYQWDAETKTITFTSQGTTPGDRITEGTGTWDTTTNTLEIKGETRKTNGDTIAFRSERSIARDGVKFRFYTVEGTGEKLNLDIKKRRHQTLDAQIRIPMGDEPRPSGENWLNIKVLQAGSETVIEGCTSGAKGVCESTARTTLSRQEEHRFFIKKQALYLIPRCEPLAHAEGDHPFQIDHGEKPGSGPEPGAGAGYLPAQWFTQPPPQDDDPCLAERHLAFFLHQLWQVRRPPTGG